MKHLLSASAMLLLLLTAACGGGQTSTTSDTDSSSTDSAALFDSLAARELADSIALQDSITSVDSAAVAKVLDSGNLKEMLELYDKQCVAVYDEFGSDGYPLGEQPASLKQALQLRTKLVPMESRMSSQQKALYDSVTGYIRRFL